MKVKSGAEKVFGTTARGRKKEPVEVSIHLENEID